MHPNAALNKQGQAQSWVSEWFTESVRATKGYLQCIESRIDGPVLGRRMPVADKDGSFRTTLEWIGPLVLGRLTSLIESVTGLLRVQKPPVDWRCFS